MQIQCPTCKTTHEYDTRSRFRPFCSERCRLIDLGAWAQETFKIPAVPEDKPIDDA
ncbi:MAG: DNA gyrase inhibitor YacG [Formosimonas sp.]